jgi:hypothetical protein
VTDEATFDVSAYAGVRTSPAVRHPTDAYALRGGSGILKVEESFTNNTDARVRFQPRMLAIEVPIPDDADLVGNTSLMSPLEFDMINVY